jgi:hypothetical protein
MIKNVLGKAATPDFMNSPFCQSMLSVPGSAGSLLVLN